MTPEIIIKDFPCGYGKTTEMINNFTSDEKYLVIVPYLSEIQRVIKDSKPIKFLEPEAEVGTKTESLHELLLTGENIATTHSLYPNLVQMADMGLLNDYNIIIDEVPDVANTVLSKSKYSIQEFYIDGGYIVVDSDGLVYPTEKWRNNQHEVSDTLTDKIRTLAESGCLYLVNGSLFLWALPKRLLTAGKSMTILSYKTNGSLLSAYLKKLSVPYELIHDPIVEEQFRATAAELITVKDITAISKLKLTHSGQTHGKGHKSYYSKVSNALKNLRAREIRDVPVENILITCLKECWASGEKTGVFAKGSKIANANWIANTTRGTNKYSHCSHLIYLYDQHINPAIAKWMKCDTRAFNDAYALTELIQWVWRSRVRKGEPITLYLPSPRMRNLFIGWLNGWYDVESNLMPKAA